MITYSRSEQRIYYRGHSWDCRSEFYPESGGTVHATLPDGEYIAVADVPPAENNAAYGTFYISTGDPRGRDIHGGGSSLDEPLAPAQGWCATYGCLRMQNRDGEELSRLIIDDGNGIRLAVSE